MSTHTQTNKQIQTAVLVLTCRIQCRLQSWGMIGAAVTSSWAKVSRPRARSWYRRTDHRMVPRTAWHWHSPLWRSRRTTSTTRSRIRECDCRSAWAPYIIRLEGGVVGLGEAGGAGRAGGAAGEGCLKAMGGSWRCSTRSSFCMFWQLRRSCSVWRRTEMGFFLAAFYTLTRTRPTYFFTPYKNKKQTQKHRISQKRLRATHEMPRGVAEID